jgi:4-diphosphocytidyl-2-C-methyl-D-erythritol kinase
LMEIGLKLGADVPFFVFGRAAFVRGIGETLTAVNVPRKSLVLAHPRVGVATARVFSHPDLVRNTAPAPIAPLNWAYGANILQDITQQIEPSAPRLLGDMQRSCKDVRMSGSGSAYFGLVAHETDALRVAAELREKRYLAWAVHSIERHPLHDFA